MQKELQILWKYLILNQINMGGQIMSLPKVKRIWLIKSLIMILLKIPFMIKNQAKVEDTCLWSTLVATSLASKTSRKIPDLLNIAKICYQIHLRSTLQKKQRPHTLPIQPEITIPETEWTTQLLISRKVITKHHLLIS